MVTITNVKLAYLRIILIACLIHVTFSQSRHVVKRGLDLGLDWTCKLWIELVKHGLVKHGLVKHGLVKHGLVKHGLVKHGLVKHGLDCRGNLLSTICFSICMYTYI